MRGDVLNGKVEGWEFLCRFISRASAFLRWGKGLEGRGEMSLRVRVQWTCSHFHRLYQPLCHSLMTAKKNYLGVPQLGDPLDFKSQSVSSCSSHGRLVYRGEVT